MLGAFLAAIYGYSSMVIISLRAIVCFEPIRNISYKLKNDTKWYHPEIPR